jgi:hypothetical protein
VAVTGFEPVVLAHEASVFPLHHTAKRPRSTGRMGAGPSPCMKLFPGRRPRSRGLAADGRDNCPLQ